MMTKKEATARARRILSAGSFACTAAGTSSQVGVHRKVMVAGKWVVLYGTMGRSPNHGEMVRQLAAHIIDMQEAQ